MGDKQNKYSIYVAEIEKGDEADHWWHSFLVLMDESEGTGKDAKVIEELHFYNDRDTFKVDPNFSDDLDNPFAGEKRLIPYVGGSEEDMLPLWNHVLKFAHEARQEQIKFGRGLKTEPEAINCRAFVLSALDAMGMDKEFYLGEFTLAAAGTKANVPMNPAVYSFEGKQDSLMMSRVKHELLKQGLIFDVGNEEEDEPVLEL